MELAAPFPPEVRGQSMSVVEPGQTGLDWVMENGDVRDATCESTIHPEEEDS